MGNSFRMMIKTVVAAALVVAVASCSGKDDEHGLKGTVKGAAEGAYVALEATNDLGAWYCVDSVAVDAGGNFFIAYDLPDSPELYRVRYGDRYVYLPVDSMGASLQLTADATGFDRGFRLTGSPTADKFTRLELDVQRVEALADADSTEALKQRIYNNYIAPGKGDILSYYILTRSYGDGRLIEYTDPLYAAVATAFQTYHPDDPHTPSLVEQAKKGVAERRKALGQRNVVEAPTVAIIDMEFADMQGRKHKLSDLTGKGRRVVLVFSSMGAADAPALNRMLRGVYDEGLADIYQVCYDTDHLVIKNGSKGLPWTVVQDPDGTASSMLLKYNVSTLPTMFIYDSRGELQQRVAEPDDLRSVLANVG